MAPASLEPIIRWRLLYHDATQRLGPQPLTMAMDKESPPLPNLHGRSHIRRPTHVFPSGRNTLALMLTAGLFVLLSTHHPATFYHYPMPTDISPQEAKIGKAPLTSIYLSALSCFFFMQKCPFLFFPFLFLKLTGSFFVSNMIQLRMRSQLNMFTMPVISKAYETWLSLHIQMASFALYIMFQRHLEFGPMFCMSDQLMKMGHVKKEIKTL